MTVYLVRHGESTWNVAKRVQGQTAHPRLTSRGRLQAREAARLIKPELDRTARPTVLTSDLTRAIQTADIIADAFGAVRETDPRLREQHQGVLQGRLSVEAAAALADVDWSDPDVRVDGGESTAQVYDRMVEAVTPLVERLRPDSIVVSHGDAIRLALAWASGCGPGDAPWVEVLNGGVFAIRSDRSWRRVGR